MIASFIFIQQQKQALIVFACYKYTILEWICFSEQRACDLFKWEGVLILSDVFLWSADAALH